MLPENDFNALSRATTSADSNGDGSPFDAIKRIRPDGSEYWLARELCKVVEYETWRNFAAAIDRAKIAAKNTGADPDVEFVQVGKLVASAT